MKIEITIGDICNQPDMDAIVNAAKPELTGGGGVDGAVHKAAGPELLEACMELPVIGGNVHGWRIGRGHAAVTPAFNLPNQHVVHTAGPIYKDDPEHAPRILHACYNNSIVFAHEAGARTLAFPAIGTGIYGYPLLPATVVAVNSVLSVAERYRNEMITLRFVCFDHENYLMYKRVLDATMIDRWKKTYYCD